MNMYSRTPLKHHTMPTTNISVKAGLVVKLIFYVFLFVNQKISCQEWQENLNLYLKNTFLLKSVTKQHIKIKIITYLYLIIKAAKH
jgi:hypothetical protein